MIMKDAWNFGPPDAALWSLPLPPPSSSPRPGAWGPDGLSLPYFLADEPRSPCLSNGVTVRGC